MVFPWSVVSERDAVAVAGGPAPRIAYGAAVTYVVGSAATVVIVEAGDRPAGSAVRTRELLALVGPFPDEAIDGLDGGGPLVGFVRLPQGLLPLGGLTHSRCTYQRHPDGGRWGLGPLNEFGRLSSCELTMAPLPFTVLDQVRPTTPPPRLPGLDWMRLLPHDAIGAVREFVAGWYTDLPPRNGDHGEAGIALPEPLLAFYRAVAGRRELLGVQDQIFPAPRLRLDQDAQVTFGAENQGVFHVRIDPAQADPPVHYTGIDVDPSIDREPLSGFLLQFLLSEAAVAGPYGAHATLSDDRLPQLLAHLRPVPLRPHPVPRDPTHFYAGDGLVAAITDLGDTTFEVYVGSRHRCALRPLREPGIAWQRFDG